MSQKIEFLSEVTATLDDYMGSDLKIVRMARVSTQTDVKEGDDKLVAFLMRNKHASPFEHCTATFLIDAPIVVAREHMRHRVQHFNEVSGRYSVLKPRFWIPSIERPLVQQGKPGAYTFETGSISDYMVSTQCLMSAYGESWRQYQTQLDLGIAKEVARYCLPVGIYSQWYATASLRGWLNFLALRTDETALQEIQDIANQIEDQLAPLYPWAMAAWESAGRQAF